MLNCGVCDIELKKEDAELKSPLDFNNVCKKHREYAEYPIIEVAKIDLGIISDFPDNLKKCVVCNCDLSISDMDFLSISKMSTNPTCSKHRMVHNWYQIDIAKLWFEFTKEVGVELDYNDETKKQFVQYRINKNK